MGDPEKWVSDTLDAGKRIMGFGHRIYRAEDPRSRILKETARRAGSTADRSWRNGSRRRLSSSSNVAIRSVPCGRTSSTTPRSSSTSPKFLRRSRLRCSPARVWRVGLLTFSSRSGRVVCFDRLLGTGLSPRAVSELDDARRGGCRGDALAQAGDERALAQLRSQWDEEIEAGARDADYRIRAQAYRSIAQFRFRQKLELLRRGLEDDSPAARGSALIALEGLSRSHPGDVNSFRPLLHDLAARDPNVAVRRLAVVCLRTGRRSATRSSSSTDRRLGRRGRGAAQDGALGLDAAREEVEGEVGSGS